MKSGLYLVIISISLCISCQPSSPDVKEDQNSDYYQEEHRPQIHFSPEANWMNDPNGMVYYEGEYHLFYQYYPDSTVWGPMHWGHAVSPNMIHWEHLPIALYPDSLGYIFSGSAVIDWENSSGLGDGNEPPMIAIFTHHDPEGERAGTETFQSQSIAYSHDRGRTWTKYSGNPVIKNPGIKDFRDPKVIWDEQRSQWLMVFAAYDRALFYTSPDLIEWTPSGEFGIPGDHRLWECPDIFPIEVEGTDETKWVLIASMQKNAPNGGTGTSYFVGDFDGRQFVGDPSEQRWLDYGTDDYAFVTWSDIPKTDGRRLGIGWMSNWQYALIVPTEQWRSAMTLPRELRLYQDDDGYTLRSLVVDELDEIRRQSEVIAQDVTYDSPTVIVSDIDDDAYELDIVFELPASGIIDIQLSNDQDEQLHIGYNVSEQGYYIDRTFAGRSDFHDAFADYHTGAASYPKELVKMKIIVDRASVELFADEGRCVMTDIYFATAPYTDISIVAESQDVTMIKGSYTALSRIWK